MHSDTPDTSATDTSATDPAALLLAPVTMARHLTALGARHLKIALGTDEIAPNAKDRRFADSWYSSNPLYRRMAQAQVANEQAVSELIDDLGLEGHTKLRSEFVANLVTSAAAPTNTLLGNPAALKEAWRTKGRSLVNGTRNAIADARGNGGMPAMVDTDPFVPGETVAATPGVVVHRNEVLEVLQYQPTTAEVHARPVFVLPPQINKYYVLDLAPGRSLAEHLVSHGHQVFMVSWRNPGPEHRDWNLDTYLTAVLDGLDAALEITGSPDANLLGVCAGGMTTAALVGHLAALGDSRAASVTFLVTVIDWSVPSTMGALLSPATLATSRAQAQATGMLSGEELGKIFAWLRPNDLVWNYWVNNYLMGKEPAAYDVLSWNVDSTNLPAGLHTDFLEVAEGNTLANGDLVALGTPIDLGKVEIDSFVVGAVTDHITPWTACYETANLVGGKSEFVLSSQGHIQALVNPSGNPKGSYHTNPVVIDRANPLAAETWKAGATLNSGSWWDHWTGWLEPRAGKLVKAPTALGSAANPSLGEAPGLYVYG